MMESGIRLNKLADVSTSVGQVFFASAVVQPLISNQYEWWIIVGGFVFSALCFGFSFYLDNISIK